MTTFSQLRILTDDFPASFRFYRDVLGLSPQEARQETGPYGCFKLGDGGTDIALFERRLMAATLAAADDPGYAAGGFGAVVVIRVDEVDAAYAAAVAAGAHGLAAPVDQAAWGMRVAHLRAPEGTVIEFCSWE